MVKATNLLPAGVDFTTLTVFQALLLFQAKAMQAIPYGAMEATEAAHSLRISPTTYLNGESATEIDWTQRAQALALERMRLVVPNPEKTRWTLTPAGEEMVRLLVAEITLRRAQLDRSPT